MKLLAMGPLLFAAFFAWAARDTFTHIFWPEFGTSDRLSSMLVFSLSVGAFTLCVLGALGIILWVPWIPRRAWFPF